MHRARIAFGLLLAVGASACPMQPQSTMEEGQDASGYRLRVFVDEVSLTFHAADKQGLAVNDLKLDELSLLDNGKPPVKILAFQSLQGVPVRAGILMDMSESMDPTRSSDRAIALQVAQRLLRQQTDEAFVMNFVRRSTVAQTWTNSPFALRDGIRDLNVRTYGQDRASGTAVFDAIYRACVDEFGHVDNAGSRNFILLFSDGEDNASFYSLEDVIGACQRSNTAIYAFRPAIHVGLSGGAKTLRSLTSESGGRIFYDDDAGAGLTDDLDTMEADLRDEYRLVYRPPSLLHDGSFHRIELKVPSRVVRVIMPSGYYAPSP